MTSKDSRDRLRDYVSAAVVRHEKPDIRLSGGRMSDFYFDGRVVTLNSFPLRLFAEFVLDGVLRRGAKAVGGPTIGADPVVGAALALAAGRGVELGGFLVRPEPKGHGLKKQVEGPELDGGAGVLLVEDTVTTGSSLIKARDALLRERPGVRVLGAVALLDREEGGEEALKAAGVELVALFRKTDFPPRPAS